MFTKRLASKLLSKHIVTVALSPGWVKTDIGGAEALLTINEAVLKLIYTIHKLSILDSGKFLSEDGVVLPW